MWNQGQMPNNQSFPNQFSVNNARFNPNTRPPLTRNVHNDLHQGNQNFSPNSFNQHPNAFLPQAPRPPVWENHRNPTQHQFERQSFNRFDQRSPEINFQRDKSPDFSDPDFRQRGEQGGGRGVYVGAWGEPVKFGEV